MSKIFSNNPDEFFTDFDIVPKEAEEQVQPITGSNKRMHNKMILFKIHYHCIHNPTNPAQLTDIDEEKRSARSDKANSWCFLKTNRKTYLVFFLSHFCRLITTLRSAVCWSTRSLSNCDCLKSSTASQNTLSRYILKERVILNQLGYIDIGFSSRENINNGKPNV